MLKLQKKHAHSSNLLTQNVNQLNTFDASNKRNKMSTKISNRFYQSLGKLFYAVAASDNVIRTEELNQLKSMVREHWLHVDHAEDEFGTDAAFQIEVVFDWLQENETSAEKCFAAFKSFKSEHHTLFSPTINALIYKTAQSIAESFSGTNDQELQLLNKIEQELHQ